MTTERYHCATSRVGRGMSECQICPLAAWWWRDSCSTLEGESSSVNGYLWFSQWLENVVTISSNSVLALEIVNHSSHWGGMKAGSGWTPQPKTAALHTSAHAPTPPTHPPTPPHTPPHTSTTPHAHHKVFLLPNCTFYLSVSYLSSKNFSEEISCSVFEGTFLFSNVLIIFA